MQIELKIGGSEMAGGDQTISVNGSLSTDKLASQTNSIGLGVGLALPPEPHDGSKAVNGPTIADVLGTDTSPQSATNKNHTTVSSNMTSTGLLNESGHATIGHNSPAPGSLSSRYDVMQHVSGSTEPPLLPSTNSTMTNVQLFQRMDEVSARMIAMEEMFNKVCCKMDEQESTIQKLKIQNEDYSLKILQEIRFLNANLPILENPEDNEKDAFVTDLLNSITNVSTSYLKKINSKNSQRFKRQRLMMSPGDLSILDKRKFSNELTGHNFNSPSGNQTESPISSHQLRASNLGEITDSQLPNHLTKQSFHLNPNAIKLRAARNTANTSKHATIQSYNDLTSLNNIGSMSLPNLTLENLTRRNFTENSVNAPAGGQSHAAPPPASKGRHGVYIQVGSDAEHANDGDMESSDDEEGYQEDDEDKQSSSETDDRHRDEDRFNIDDEEEDEAEEEEDTDKELFGIRSGKRIHQSEKRQRDKLKRKRKESLNGPIIKSAPSSQTNAAHTQPVEERLHLRNGNRACPYVADKERDLNYTLLKAPANVKTIWQEYVEGIDGNPPVKFLEETYGNKWRLSRNVKTFARRKRLYKFILRGINKGRSADDMVEILEKRRIYKNEHGEVKKRTIGWLQQSLSGI